MAFEPALNDVIVSALNPTYGPADASTLLSRWMVAVGIPKWSQDAIRTYIVAIHPHLASSSYNDMLYFFFDGFNLTSFRLLEDGGFRLLEGNLDVRLLEA